MVSNLIIASVYICFELKSCTGILLIQIKEMHTCQKKIIRNIQCLIKVIITNMMCYVQGTGSHESHELY